MDEGMAVYSSKTSGKGAGGFGGIFNFFSLKVRIEDTPMRVTHSATVPRGGDISDLRYKMSHSGLA